MRSPLGVPALLLTALLAALLPAGLAGCAADDSEDTLTVLAAASLTDVFAELADDFEAAHPGTEVELVLGSSTDLAENAADGAPGDVLATADAASARLAVDAGATAAEPVTFATNVLVLVTAPGNPAGLEGLADLDRVTWVRCADDVPCGRVALSLLEDAGAEARPASLEVDVRATLEKVVSGEADAGLVYASDAVAAGADVATVPLASADAVPASYHLAPLVQAEDAELADAWIELVTSEEGRQVLRDAGFTVP